MFCSIFYLNFQNFNRGELCSKLHSENRFVLMGELLAANRLPKFCDGFRNMISTNSANLEMCVLRNVFDIASTFANWQPEIAK